MEAQPEIQTPEPEKKKYLAFISYSHQDNKDPGRKWADWIKKTVEGFPSEGHARPDTFQKVFADIYDLHGTRKVTDELEAHLNASRFLVLILSDKSVASEWVGKEIDIFGRRGNRWHDIVIVVVGGDDRNVRKVLSGHQEWAAALGMKLEHDPSDDPLYADFRLKRMHPEEGRTHESLRPVDGWTEPKSVVGFLKQDTTWGESHRRRWKDDYARDHDEAKFKLLAALLGKDPGALRLIAQRSLWRRVVMWLVALCVVMTGVTWSISSAEGRARLDRDRAEQARDEAERERAAARRALMHVGNAYERAADLLGETLAEVSEKIRDGEDAEAVLASARQCVVTEFGTLPAEDDRSEDGRYMRAITLGHRGNLALKSKQYTVAEELLTEAKKLQIALWLDKPESDEFRHGKALACDNLGDLHLEIARVDSGKPLPEDDEGKKNREKAISSRIDRAIGEYQEGLTIATDLVKTSAEKPLARDDLAVGHYKIAEAQLMARKFDSAMENLMRGLPYVEQAAAADPGYDRWQVHLGGYHFLIAQSSAQYGRDAEAIAAYERAGKIFFRLSETHPTNTKYRTMSKRIQDAINELK
jgi:tetratricopeptide (TPR) repeat protein